MRTARYPWRLLGWVFPVLLAASGASGAGGSLIVHTDDAVSYTGSVCPLFTAHGPGSCAQANTRTDKDSTTPALVWLIAAFHPTAAPAASGIVFGLDHNLAPGEGRFAHSGPCGPGSFEFPDLGWPESGGDVVYFEQAVDDTLFAFYYLDAYGDLPGSHLGTGIHPGYGRAYFLDDGNPAIEDVIERFGVVRWGADGANSCPASLPTGGCCLADMTCSIELERECIRLGGAYSGDATTCDEPCGPCCYWSEEESQVFRRCIATTVNNCLDDTQWNSIKIETNCWGLVGAEWGVPGMPCTNDPGQAEELWYCGDPRVNDCNPILLETWGRVKVIFR